MESHCSARTSRDAATWSALLLPSPVVAPLLLLPPPGQTPPLSCSELPQLLALSSVFVCSGSTNGNGKSASPARRMMPGPLLLLSPSPAASESSGGGPRALGSLGRRGRGAKRANSSSRRPAAPYSPASFSKQTHALSSPGSMCAQCEHPRPFLSAFVRLLITSYPHLHVGGSVCESSLGIPVKKNTSADRDQAAALFTPSFFPSSKKRASLSSEKFMCQASLTNECIE
ncbi:hypothetical protein NDU88_002161 [Pleurodeles waltl]|uniref:Uncharacterized protein n=1 Tax=Pleurodeles waltl TaxID=8319 RepID=A0AAV7W278_PLEWA|nr:hypothetical protein NDU88_002161 [Pleurodeles waltl]